MKGKLTALAAFISLMLLATPAPAHDTFNEAFDNSPLPDHAMTVSAVDGLAPLTKAGIKGWNDFIGRPLFVYSDDYINATVTVRASDQNLATTVPSHSWCEVEIHFRSLRVMKHELGHCLGLADHKEGYPKCGTPPPGTYHGIMSYCYGKKFTQTDYVAVWRIGVEGRRTGQVACTLTCTMGKCTNSVEWGFID